MKRGPWARLAIRQSTTGIVPYLVAAAQLVNRLDPWERQPPRFIQHVLAEHLGEKKRPLIGPFSADRSLPADVLNLA